MAYKDIVLADVPAVYVPFEGGIPFNDGGTLGPNISRSGGSARPGAGIDGSDAYYAPLYVYSAESAAVEAIITSGTWTHEAWFKTGVQSATQRIWSWHTDSYLGLSQTYGLFLWNGGIVNNAALPDYRDNQWHHVVTVVDNLAAKVYVDGAEVLSATMPAFSTSPTNFMLIGNDTNTNVDGYVDELALYDYALTPAQITSHYTMTPPAPPGQWRGWGLPL